MTDDVISYYFFLPFSWCYVVFHLDNPRHRLHSFPTDFDLWIYYERAFAIGGRFIIISF